MENKELETWLKETKAKNLSLEQLADEINFVYSREIYLALDGRESTDKAQILFNQWQKEKEFSPQRGDRVLVWNESEIDSSERIFFEINEEDVVCFEDEVEFNNYRKRGTFILMQFKHMKPLPTETDFKSKVIELIDGEIKVWQKDFEASVKDEDFQSCSVNFIAKMACEKILNKIKQL